LGRWQTEAELLALAILGFQVWGSKYQVQSSRTALARGAVQYRFCLAQQIMDGGFRNNIVRQPKDRQEDSGARQDYRQARSAIPQRGMIGGLRHGSPTISRFQRAKPRGGPATAGKLRACFEHKYTINGSGCQGQKWARLHEMTNAELRMTKQCRMPKRRPSRQAGRALAEAVFRAQAGWWLDVAAAAECRRYEKPCQCAK
jgi:hypothetical protein